ncbi:MAG TPA: HAD-IIIA family hydrolase [Gemmataceae bacterium]|jgi:histidinol-phosphate phosphatase family protein|nr:HAD-IIIA family hydrolase [Gemmataceae bacterium]
MRTVFLDRDGVINRKRPDPEYVTRWEEFEFLPGAKEAVGLLKRAGLRVVVITNQRGISLGRMTEAALQNIHRRMQEQLAARGQAADAVFYCPHDDGQCTCRKPQAGLFWQARRQFPDIDFADSVVIGDALSDLEPGARLGCRTFLIAEGPRRDSILREASARGIAVDGVAPTLLDVAVRYVLADADVPLSAAVGRALLPIPPRAHRPGPSERERSRYDNMLEARTLNHMTTADWPLVQPAPTAGGSWGEPRLNVCMLAACPFPANHGTAGSIREMAEAIVERGHEVHVVTYHMGEDIPVKGPHIHRVPDWTSESSVIVGPTVRRPLYDLQMIFKAVQVIRHYSCDIIQAHGYEAALVGWACRRLTGLPLVYNGHNTMADELPSYQFIRPKWLALALGRVLDALVPRVADRTMPHSANMERFFRRMGLAARTDPVLRIGIELAGEPRGDGGEVRRRYGLGQGPVVLYAGVTDEFQRLDLLLEAMVAVVRRDPRAKLLMVIPVPNERQLANIRRRAAELGVADHVVLTEPQPLPVVRDFLAACDVAVAPRPRTPGFPVKVLNYMAAKRPCVLYASAAFSGLVHRDNAYLVSPDTGAALGAGILEVLGDGKLRQRLSQEGYQWVRAHHDRRLTAQQVCDTFFRTLACTGRSHLLSRRPLVFPRPVRAPGDALPAASNNGQARHERMALEVHASASG